MYWGCFIQLRPCLLVHIVCLTQVSPEWPSFILAVWKSVDTFREAKRLRGGFLGIIWEAAFEHRSV